MKRTLGALVSVKNTGAEELCGIPAGSSRVVFMDYQWFLDHASSVPNLLFAGTFEAYDIGEAQLLPSSTAGGLVLQIISEAQNVHNDYLQAMTDNVRQEVLVGWNLDVAPIFVAVVRSEMLVVGLSSLGVSAASILQKMAAPLQALSVGMFAEAAALLAAVPNDAFLTTDRIALYQAMALSANAIPT
jgi:hypothetical protein